MWIVNCPLTAIEFIDWVNLHKVRCVFFFLSAK